MNQTLFRGINSSREKSIGIWATKMPLAVLLIAVAFSFCSKGGGMGTLPDPDDKPTIIGKFQVSEDKILDSAGAQFVPKGVNVNGPQWPWTRATVPDADLIVDVWKCNTVRVNCWPQNPPYANNNNGDLDAIVKTFTAKKAVVIIEDHSFTGRYPNAAELTASIAWWKALAQKYKANGYVWFNLMNEPGSAGTAVASTWLDVHEAIIKAIREVGAENIIVCDEQGYGQANGFDDPKSSAAITYGEALTAKYKNLLFSLHLYDYWIYGQSRLENYIAALKAKKLALLIGEYGVGNTYSAQVATAVFKACLPAQVGRIGWHWVGEDVHKLTITGSGGGWEIDNKTGAKPGNLSFVGNLVWMDNHNQLQPSDVALIPPTVIISNPGFEEGEPQNNSSGIAGWINFGTAAIDATASNVKEGQFSVKVKEGEAGGLGQPIYLQPSATYRLTAWGKHSTVAASPTIVGLKYAATFGGTEVDLAFLSFTEASFVEKTVTFTTPAQLARMFLVIYKSETAPAFWCDDIRIEKL